MRDCWATVSTRETILCAIKEVTDELELDLERDKANDNTDSDTEGLLTSSPSSFAKGSVNEGRKFIRKLFPKERDALKNDCRCSCTNDDWSKFYVMVPKESHSNSNYDQESDFSMEFKSLVSDTHFNGFIVFDLTDPISGEQSKAVYKKIVSNESNVSDWSMIPPGVHSNVCISNSSISLRHCVVYRNSFISNTFIAQEAVIVNCGRITSSGEITTEDFYGKMEISVGAESGGGRLLALTAESTMIDVGRQLQSRSKLDTDSPSPIRSSMVFNVLLPGSVIRDTPTVHNVFLYPFSSIEGACSVKNSTLFSYAQISNGSIVSDVLMQFHATISDNSKINNVLLMEHSHCGPSSIVESSIMGPDSHASAGEIHASVFGPNTNAHHQSLLIGVIWPLGRGNVGYGANVGSNHTGRLPDQECTAGEGIFWGLSCIVKFPFDLSMAPYSMIAAGTKLSPQRITLPFSLIVESSKDSVNDIIPGWVLQHSPYTLARNDKKYVTRRKAKVHAYYTGWKIIRPSTVEKCRKARNLLKKSLGGEENPTPLETTPGIGECRLTERARDCGVRAYTNCIQLYALQGLLKWLNAIVPEDSYGSDLSSIFHLIQEEFGQTKVTVFGSDNDSFSQVRWPAFPWDVNECSIDQMEWEYQRKLLVTEFPVTSDGKLYDMQWIEELLKKLEILEDDFANRVATSKQRDDLRGATIVPGYAEAHVASEDDPVIVEIREKAKTSKLIVQLLIDKLKN